jgi:tetratricopeptide (TPR) repeat protein
VNHPHQNFAPQRLRPALLAAGLLLLAAIAFYNTFQVPFLFDDIPSIRDNPAIRGFSTAILPWHGSGGLTVNGRPVVGLTLALNHAVSGNHVWSYHAFNLLIHALAGLMLFGILGRTLRSTGLRAGFGDQAVPLAFMAAAAWIVHPLQTEAVTYVIQRTEVLAGLFYLLTIYGFIRGVDSARPWRWYVVSVSACLLGAGSKEVIASAPLIVLLYDRTFLSGSFRAAWRQRWRTYLALASSWLVLGWLVVAAQGRGGTAGFGSGVSVWSYALTQCRAVVLYVTLAIWPHPLVFDYGEMTARSFAEVAPAALCLCALLGAVAVALRRRPVLGFVGAWFFAILAPSSSIVPIATQTIAEHRMYLPLAGVLMLVMVGVGRIAGRWGTIAGFTIIVALTGLTVARNLTYQSALMLWSDTVEKCPENPRAHNSLGQALFDSGHVQESLAQYQIAVRLDPTYAEAHYNLAIALARLKRTPEAIEHYRRALQLQPRNTAAHINLGLLLNEAGRSVEAIDHLQQAVGLQPDFAPAHNDLGIALADAGRWAEAVTQQETAIRLQPDYVDAHYNLGNALAQLGRLSEAADHFEQTLHLAPDDLMAHNNLGNVWVGLHRWAEAREHYQAALRLNPDFIPARRNLANLLVEMDRLPEALHHLQILSRLRPDDREISAELARLQAQVEHHQN